jgi:enterochelin esterase-like enzyme
MKRLLLIMNITIFAFGYPQDMEKFIGDVNNSPREKRQAMVDSLLASISEFPIAQSDTAYFVYTSNSAHTVLIAGDFNGWNPGAATMQAIEGSDMYYLRQIFHRDARLDYKYVVNGSNWILDPRNPNTVSGGYGANSELAMPAYVHPPEIDFRSDIQHGTISNFTHTSEMLGNSRSIRVYLPPGYEPERETTYPLVFVNDGNEYVQLGSMINVLDYLIAEQTIEKLIVVFIDPVNRMVEYTLDSNYTDMLKHELLPLIERRYHVSQDPYQRLIIGASLGGLVSAYTVYRHPQTFALCASQSGAFWYDDGWLISAFDSLEDSEWRRFYLDWGTYYDTAESGEDLESVLKAKEFQTASKKWHEGHSWGNWRAHIDDLLVYHFPGQSTPLRGANYAKPDQSLQLRAYPNPFNSSLAIKFKQSSPFPANINIYNSVGERVFSHASRSNSIGQKTVRLNFRHLHHYDLASGVYICRVSSGTQVESLRLIYLK